MNISELKKLLKTSTSVLVMENGNPDLVIMDYKSYLQLAKVSEREEVPVRDTANGQDFLPESGQDTGNGFSEQSAREAEILEKLNREIYMLKQQIQAEEDKVGGNPPPDLTF